jgi:hypothetical protein
MGRNQALGPNDRERKEKSTSVDVNDGASLTEAVKAASEND